MRTRSGTVALLALVIGCLVPAAMAAAAGGLDSSYGEGGIVRVVPPLPAGLYLTEYPAGEGAVAPSGVAYYSVAVSPCRNRFEASNCESTESALVRYLPGGSIDRSFGEGGVALLGGDQDPAAIGADSRGRLLTVSGYLGQGDVVVRRYRATGALDRSFGHGGQVSIPGIEYADLILRAGRGRVLVGHSEFGRGGKFPSQGLSLARLLPDGRPDPSFGKAGRAHYLLPGTPGPIAVGTRGAIYVGGSFCCSGFAPLSRISARGRIDTRFNARARAAEARLLTGYRQPEVNAVVPRPGGEIDLLGGATRFSEPESGFSLRLRGDGRADTDYGEHGLQSLSAQVAAAAPARGGATIALSEVPPSEGGGQVSALRLLADGAPDPAFGGGSWLKLPEVGTGASATALAGGDVMVFVRGYRECREPCAASSYFVRLDESKPRRGGKGGKQR